MGSLFRPDNFIAGPGFSGIPTVLYYHPDAAELLENVLDRVRFELEACDSPQGFQICSSFGGQMSQITSLLQLKLKEEWPDKLTFGYHIYPSPIVSDTVIEPYHAVFAMFQAMNNLDAAVLIDNKRLYDLAIHFGEKNPRYENLNLFAAIALRDFTSLFRFNQHSNQNDNATRYDMRKLASSVVPFPRTHFLTTSISPFVSPKYYGPVDQTFITNQLFQKQNLLVECDRIGKCLGSYLLYRGFPSQLSSFQNNIRDVSHREQILFNWNDHLASNSVGPPLANSQPAGLGIFNSTSIVEILKRVLQAFKLMYDRKAFVHWYTSEGMDEMEFEEAKSGMVRQSLQLDDIVG